MTQHNQTKREYYLQLLTEHKQALSKSRRIIEQLLCKVELEINSSIKSENYDNLFGNKESLANVAVKLSTIFPNLLHDDIVDSITQYLIWAKHKQNFMPRIRRF
jgi:hypothetical protein